jgi:sulfite reductase beta subunit-like hemoprotein
MCHAPCTGGRSNTKGMAVVTLRYSRNRQQIKAHIRYITHRRGQDGERISRLLFDERGLADKQAVYRMIDAARRGTLFYKVMISPDPVKEDADRDLDLQQITRRTPLRLEREFGRHVRFVAVVHADHTDKRHVHGIFLVEGRLSREAFKTLARTARLAATQEARLQRAGRERVRAHPRYPQIAAAVRSLRLSGQGSGASLPRRPQPACPACGYGELTGIPAYLAYCPSCHKRLRPEAKARLGLEAVA